MLKGQKSKLSRPKDSSSYSNNNVPYYLGVHPDANQLSRDKASTNGKYRSEMSPQFPSGFMNMELGDHYIDQYTGNNQKLKRNKRKKSIKGSQNDVQIRQEGLVFQNKLQIPETQAVRVRSYPHKEENSLDRKVQNIQSGAIKSGRDAIREAEQIDSPTIKVNRVEEVDPNTYSYRPKKNKQVKSGKVPNNNSIFMIELTGSTQDVRLPQNSYNLTKKRDPIASHESSNILLEPRQSEQDKKLLKKMTYLKSTVAVNQRLEATYQRQKICCSYFSNPEYSVSLKSGQFLLNGKKQLGHINSHYNITASSGEFEDNNKAYLGYVRGNFTGSEYNIYQFDNQTHDLVGTVYYETSVGCCSNFRKIEAYFKIPSLAHCDSSARQSQTLREAYNDSKGSSRGSIVRLISKEPVYNEKHDCYILNFRGKSKMGSIKNMALIQQSKPEQYILMLCKTAGHQFHLQVGHPMSPLVGMGVLLSSFDFKLCTQ